MNAGTDDDWNLRLFVFSPGGIITVSLLSFFLWVLWAISDREIHIVTLALDESTVARIYEDNYCDQTRFLRFDIKIDGRASQQYGTGVDFVCHYSVRPELFRVVCVKSEAVCGVFYDDKKREFLVFAYDQKQQTSFPGPTNDSVPDQFRAILEREASATYKDRITRR